MNKKLGRAVSGALAVALIGIGGVAPAQAKTVTDNCRYYSTGYVGVKECWVTYNWFERWALHNDNGWESQEMWVL